MRDPRNAFRPFIVKETQAAREKLAAKHFALAAVMERQFSTYYRQPPKALPSPAPVDAKPAGAKRWRQE